MQFISFTKVLHLEATPLPSSILFSSSSTLYTLLIKIHWTTASMPKSTTYKLSPLNTHWCACVTACLSTCGPLPWCSVTQIFLLSMKKQEQERERGREGCWEEREEGKGGKGVVIRVPTRRCPWFWTKLHFHPVWARSSQLPSIFLFIIYFLLLLLSEPLAPLLPPLPIHNAPLFFSPRFFFPSILLSQISLCNSYWASIPDWSIDKEQGEVPAAETLLMDTNFLFIMLVRRNEK